MTFWSRIWRIRGSICSTRMISRALATVRSGRLWDFRPRIFAALPLGVKNQPEVVALPSGPQLPARPHGGVTFLEVRDPPLLPVAQAHHVELPHAGALRAVEQPLVVGRRHRVVVHRPGRRVGEPGALAVEPDAEQLDVAANLRRVEPRPAVTAPER